MDPLPRCSPPRVLVEKRASGDPETSQAPVRQTNPAGSTGMPALSPICGYLIVAVPGEIASHGSAPDFPIIQVHERAGRIALNGHGALHTSCNERQSGQKGNPSRHDGSISAHEPSRQDRWPRRVVCPIPRRAINYPIRMRVRFEFPQPIIRSQRDERACHVSRYALYFDA